MQTDYDYMDNSTAETTVERSFFTKVYSWMALALIVTGITALLVANTPQITRLLFMGDSMIVFFVLVIAEIALVAFLTRQINKLSVPMATGAFFLYSILNGVTLSFIFILYTRASIASTFFITAGTFGAMSAYGFLTKRDLSNIGSILMMGLMGIIIASVVNWFLQSETIYWIITYVGIVVFIGLIAYDTQKLKALSKSSASEDETTTEKASIIGALILYLDFINLFILLLRIFGRRR